MASNVSSDPSLDAYHPLGPQYYKSERDAARRFVDSNATPDQIDEYLIEQWEQFRRWNQGFIDGQKWSPINLTAEEKEICAKVRDSFHPDMVAATSTCQVAWRTFYKIGLCLSDPNLDREKTSYIKKWRGAVFRSYSALFQPTDTGVKVMLILDRIYKSKYGKKVYKALCMTTGQDKAVTMWLESQSSLREIWIPHDLETEKCPHLVPPYESRKDIPKFKKNFDKEIHKLCGIRPFYKETLAEVHPTKTTQVRVMLDVLKGVKYLNDQGYAHRDIKPNNIFFTPQGAKLGDYGLVCPLGSENSIGTRNYASPEIYRVNDGVGTKCAVWEIAVTGLELLGYPIWDRVFIALKMQNLLTDEIVTKTLEGWKKVRVIREFVTHLDHDLFEIYRRCLRVNPDDRPSVEELIAEFEKLTQPEAQPPSAAKAAEG